MLHQGGLPACLSLYLSVCLSTCLSVCLWLSWLTNPGMSLGSVRALGWPQGCRCLRTMHSHPRGASNHTKCEESPTLVITPVASQLQMLPCQEALWLQPSNRKRPRPAPKKLRLCCLFFLLVAFPPTFTQRKTKKKQQQEKRWLLTSTPAFVNYNPFKLIPGNLSRAACVPFQSARPPCQPLPF